MSRSVQDANADPEERQQKPPELAAQLRGPVRIRYTEDREVGGATIDEVDRVVK